MKAASPFSSKIGTSTLHQVAKAKMLTLWRKPNTTPLPLRLPEPPKATVNHKVSLVLRRWHGKVRVIIIHIKVIVNRHNSKYPKPNFVHNAGLYESLRFSLNESSGLLRWSSPLLSWIIWPLFQIKLTKHDLPQWSLDTHIRRLGFSYGDNFSPSCLGVFTEPSKSSFRIGPLLQHLCLIMEAILP